MKKTIIVMFFGFLLAVSTGWAQSSQRTHTRPPYSGPRKQGKNHTRPRPRLTPQGQKAGGFGKRKWKYKSAP